MVVSLEDLGWRLTWDKKGRCPISTSEKVIVPSDLDELDVYLSPAPPKQQEDGSWVRYEIHSRILQRYKGNNDYHHNNYFIYDVIAGERKKEIKDIIVNSIAIEEMFYFEKAIEFETINKWVQDKKILVDDNGAMNKETALNYKPFVYFAPNSSNTLRYEDIFDKEMFFETEPEYVSGFNLKAANLDNNKLFINDFICNNDEFTFGIRFMAPSEVGFDNDIIIFKHQNFKLYINHTTKRAVLELVNVLGHNFVYEIPKELFVNQFYSFIFTYNNGNLEIIFDEITKKTKSNIVLKTKYYLDYMEGVKSFVDRETGAISIYRHDYDLYKKSLVDLDYFEKIYFSTTKPLYSCVSFFCDNYYRSYYDVRFISRNSAYYDNVNSYPSLRKDSVKVRITGIKNKQFYLQAFLNIAQKQQIEKVIERVNPYTGELEELSREEYII